MIRQVPLPPVRLNLEECLRFLAHDPAWPRRLGLGALGSLPGLTIAGALFVQGYMLLLEPLFVLAIVAGLLLLGLCTIGDFSIRLSFTRLPGQPCRYDRQATARRSGRNGMRDAAR